VEEMDEGKAAEEEDEDVEENCANAR